MSLSQPRKAGESRHDDFADEHDLFYPTRLNPSYALRAYYSGKRLSRRAMAGYIYAVACELAFTSYSNNTRFSVSNSTIAELVGTSERVIQKYMMEFREIGLIRTEVRRDEHGRNLPNLNYIRRVPPPADAVRQLPPTTPQDTPAPRSATKQPDPVPVAIEEPEERLRRIARQADLPLADVITLATQFVSEDGSEIQWVGLEGACFALRRRRA